VANFGAFMEIEPGVDGMIHISDLSWTKKYNHPSEALQKGQDIKCVVLEVNQEKRRISLGIKQLTEDPWIRAIPEKYIPGHIIKGKVAKLTNFGAFVELEPDLEGLLHISELADHKINRPQDIVNVGDEIEVKILKVDTEARKIGLSLRRVQWAAEEQTAEHTKQQAPTEVQAGIPDIEIQQEKTVGEEETEPDGQQDTMNKTTAADAEGQESNIQPTQSEQDVDGQSQANGDDSTEQST
jgi:small subunit ribosomal protein S1